MGQISWQAPAQLLNEQKSCPRAQRLLMLLSQLGSAVLDAERLPDLKTRTAGFISLLKTIIIIESRFPLICTWIGNLKSTG